MYSVTPSSILAYTVRSFAYLGVACVILRITVSFEDGTATNPEVKDLQEQQSMAEMSKIIAALRANLQAGS